MIYKMPSLIRLRTLADELPKLYKGDNEARKAFLCLYQRVVENTKSDLNDKLCSQILMGALVFELEYIKQFEYKGRSPDKNQSLIGRVIGNGSSLYTIIKKNADVTQENYLNDAQRLIYLNKFYWHVRKQQPENKELLTEIIARMALVKKREMLRLGILAEGIPSLNVLRKNISNVIDKYKQASRFSYFRDSSHLKALKFLDFINQTCDAIYPVDEKEAEGFPLDFAYLQSCNARAGAIILILLSVSSEKKYLVLSLENSVLFQNIESYFKSLVETSTEKKIEWLRSLSSHINILKLNSLAFKQLAEKWKKESIDIEEWLNKIEKIINAQKEMNETSWSRIIYHYLVNCGISLVAARPAKIVLPILSTTVIGCLSGPIGTVAYLSGGAVLMGQFGRLVSNKLVPRGVSYLFAWILDKFGGKIADLTADAARITVSLTQEGLKSLREHPTLLPEDREFIQDWVDTLLQLPTEVMSEEEKDQIRYVLGLKHQDDNTLKLKMDM